MSCSGILRENQNGGRGRPQILDKCKSCQRWKSQHNFSEKNKSQKPIDKVSVSSTYPISLLSPKSMRQKCDNYRKENATLKQSISNIKKDFSCLSIVRRDNLVPDKKNDTRIADMSEIAIKPEPPDIDQEVSFDFNSTSNESFNSDFDQHDTIRNLVSFEETIKIEPGYSDESSDKLIKEDNNQEMNDDKADDCNMDHSNKNRFPCEFCDKKFKWNSDLKIHLRTHSGERPFICEICLYEFKTCHELKMHERIHTGERPHSCQICLKDFPTNSGLKKHEITHSDERPFTCETCHLTFKRSDRLKCHMKTHTPDRPFACKICDSRFKTNKNLKTHVATHSTERNYSCKTCLKMFKTDSNLRNHMRTHIGPI